VIVAALVLAAQLAAPAPAPVEDAEITVLARRLEAVAAIVTRDPQGRMHCDLSQSSGDPKTDAKLCETAARCVKKGAVDNVAVKACIDKRKPELLRDFAANLRGKAG
jgi:hypothetical protein